MSRIAWTAAGELSASPDVVAAKPGSITVPFSNILKSGTLISTDVGAAGSVVAFGLLVLLADALLALFAPHRETQVALERPTFDDRLTVFAAGAACSLGAWPNYGSRCVFDWREPDHAPGIIAFEQR
jgi:hypothetical protein